MYLFDARVFNVDGGGGVQDIILTYIVVCIRSVHNNNKAPTVYHTNY